MLFSTSFLIRRRNWMILQFLTVGSALLYSCKPFQIGEYRVILFFCTCYAAPTIFRPILLKSSEQETIIVVVNDKQGEFQYHLPQLAVNFANSPKSESYLDELQALNFREKKKKQNLVLIIVFEWNLACFYLAGIFIKCSYIFSPKISSCSTNACLFFSREAN
ncbi:hypothetical protein BD560DRAFT_387052 [Blakeslea trispora]|nr:hypothetical protein BD560DRAFT_387052 [Blakeslea trispora]